MSNIKIFRANRGEGKTKWLVERIKECAKSGGKLYYVGTEYSFHAVKRVYEVTYNELCPAAYYDGDDLTPYDSFFTDELINNMMTVSKYKSDVIEHGCDWYITMSKEDFVD